MPAIFNDPETKSLALTFIKEDVLEALKEYHEIPHEYYSVKVENPGYDVYLLALDEVNHAWSVALLELHYAPKHFHKQGMEHFIVMDGTLSIDLDGDIHCLPSGQSVSIPPDVTHLLKSAISTPVRLLCINVPAFDPQDMHIL